VKQFSVHFFTQLLFGLLLISLPILVVPVTEQFVVHSKLAVIIIGSLLILTLYAIQSIKNKVLGFTLSPLTLPVLGFGASVLASTFFSGNYPVENLLGMGGLYLAFVVLVLLGGSIFRAIKPASSIISILLFVNVVLLIFAVLELVGYGPAFLINLLIPNQLPTNSLIFSVTGSSLVGLQIATVTLVGVVIAVLTKEFKANIFKIFATGATVVSLLIHGWAVLPGQDSASLIMPLTANWSIAVDTLRAPRTALIGFGPQSFTDAYNIFRPEWLNMTEFIGTQFSQGSNILLTLLVTTGLLGLISFLSIFFVLFKQSKLITNQTKPLHWMIISVLAVLLLLPPNIVIIGLLGILLAVWIASESSRFADIEIQGLSVRSKKGADPEHKLYVQSTGAVYLLSGALLLLVATATYGYARAYSAEVFLYNSTKSALNDDVVGVYQNQQRAIELNPYVDYFRRRYSATNINIAAGLAQQEEMSETEQAEFSELVQQAIREARAATVLDELDANNWLNLAQVYRSLIGVAEDAQQWTVSSYISAIQLAPSDPGLRIEAGGVLFASESYQDSIQLFQEAISLKPDLPNGYYNLANALVKVENYEQARNAYQQTLLLLEPDTDDYVQTAKELSDLEEKMETDNQDQSGVQQTETETPSINSQNLIQDSQIIQPTQSEINFEQTPVDSQTTPSDQPDVQTNI
jgi:cytochrome c-type biogenesis protein CcmH/NrfG